mgnify:CR=1 FL=1
MKKITQTVIKYAINYDNGECGVELSAKMDGRQRPPSAAMKLGIYFEYLVSGSTGLTDEIPQPVLLKNGELSAAYRTVTNQAERVRNVLSDSGFQILHAGKYFERGNLGGHIDVVAIKDGKHCIIDLKYTGNLDDKWSTYGWAFSDKQKDFHSIQAIHYKAIFEYDIDFYYLVCESTDDGLIELFKIEPSDESINRHLDRVKNAIDFVELKELQLLEARPEYNRCQSCAIFKDCTHRIETLTPKTINL